MVVVVVELRRSGGVEVVVADLGFIVDDGVPIPIEDRSVAAVSPPELLR